MIRPRGRVLVAETPIQFLENWREANIYAEPRALEQLDATVAQCIADAAEAGISADDLARAAGGESRRVPSHRNYRYERMMPRGAKGEKRPAEVLLRDRLAFVFLKMLKRADVGSEVRFEHQASAVPIP